MTETKHAIEAAADRNPYAKVGQCDYSKTGWAWQYRSGACTCDPAPKPDGWKFNPKTGEWERAKEQKP
jgi:hypothetical protein